MFFVKKSRLVFFLFISSFWFTLNQSFQFPSTTFNPTFNLRIRLCQQIGKVYHQYRVLLCKYIRKLSYFTQNVLQQALDYFRKFSGLFEDIPRKVWQHSPEYNIHPIPRVPRIPFPVPIFLVWHNLILNLFYVLCL